MIKKYRITSGMDLELTLGIDTDVLSEELAHEINDFWAGADEILEASDNDVYQAVVRRAANPIWNELLNDWDGVWALEQLGKSEGWPERHGITILDYELPDRDQCSLDVTQLP